MKKTLIALFMLLSATMLAQELKPTFEKSEDGIKGTYFHENGEISQQGFYNENGKLDGKWKSFDNEGKKVSVGEYNNGVKTGKWYFWNGNTLSEVNYDNNTIATIKTHANDSNVAVNFNK